MFWGIVRHRINATTTLSAILLALLVVSGAAHAQVAGELRGRITDAGTARPIADARIELVGRSEITRSDADGQYVIRGIESRAYVVRYRALGFTERAADIDIVNGRSTRLDVRLEANAAMLQRVLVRSAPGTGDTGVVNATVYTRSAIEASGRRDIGELLNTTPGVVVTQAGGAGQTSRVSIRGAGANQTLVLVDGVPVNSAISGDADLSRVSLESVERVIVRTGAQSARYGPRAMAGVIEIVTRKPQREMSSMVRVGAFGERHAAVSAGGTMSRQPATSRTTASGSHIAETSRRTIGGSLTVDHRAVVGDFTYDVPALRGGGRSARVNADASSTGAVANASYDGGATNAAVRATWQRNERGLAGSIVQQSLTGRQSGDRQGAGINATHRAGLMAYSASFDLSREHAAFGDPFPPFGGAYHDTLRATGANATVSAVLEHRAFAAAGGADVRTLDVRSTMLAAGAPHWQRVAGLWSNLRAAHTSARTGIRLDGELSARVDGSSLVAGNAFSPRAAVRGSRGAISTSLSLGAGYAPPTLADQFFHEGVQTRVNPTLRPERVRGDLEGRVTVRDQQVGAVLLGAEAAAFRADIDGMILWLPDFRFIWSPSNFDVSRQGFELTATALVPVVGVDIQAGINHTDITYNGGVLAGQVAYRPRETANIRIGVAPRRARVDVTHRYVGTRRTIAGSYLNSLDPYWMTDLKISTTQRHTAWTFTTIAGVENALNRSAAMLVDYPFPTRTWTLSLRVRRNTN